MGDTDGSAAARYIIAQIEKEDMNLEALRREIELARHDMRKSKKNISTAEERAAEISKFICGLDGFSAAEKNTIVKDVVQECAWDGDTLFLRF